MDYTGIADIITALGALATGVAALLVAIRATRARSGAPPPEPPANGDPDGE